MTWVVGKVSHYHVAKPFPYFPHGPQFKQKDVGRQPWISSLICWQYWGHDGVSQLYSAVQTADHMYSWVYSLVQLGPSPFCQPNNVHAKYIYSQINASLRDVRSSGQNDVRLRAIKSSGEECQTHHCQHNSMNIGDKSQTEKWGWSIKTKPIIAKPKAKTENYFKIVKTP